MRYVRAFEDSDAWRPPRHGLAPVSRAKSHEARGARGGLL